MEQMGWKKLLRSHGFDFKAGTQTIEKKYGEDSLIIIKRIKPLRFEIVVKARNGHAMFFHREAEVLAASLRKYGLVKFEA